MEHRKARYGAASGLKEGKADDTFSFQFLDPQPSQWSRERQYMNLRLILEGIIQTSNNIGYSIMLLSRIRGFSSQSDDFSPRAVAGDFRYSKLNTLSNSVEHNGVADFLLWRRTPRRKKYFHLI
jgi:hypothetical protein